MKKIISSLALIILIAACKKTEISTPSEQESITTGSERQGPPPPPVNANPAFAFSDYKKINQQLSVLSIYVMDVTGANPTPVYSNYSGNGNNTVVNYPDYPAWSPDGSKLCFTLNTKDLYTLNISLVSGVPTGSNATKIGDGVAGGGSYKQGKWRPGANQIACVWKKTGDPDKIRILPSGGGSPSDLYTAASTDWTLEDDIAFKSNGSNLVFSERQVSTGNVFLKVLDVNTSLVIKSIDLSQYGSIREVEWAKSSGSNTVFITTEPRCDSINNGGAHSLRKVDVGAASPSLTFLSLSVGNICISPDDTKITVSAGVGAVCNPNSPFCCSFSYSGALILTLATNTSASTGFNGTEGAGRYNYYDWKR